MKKVIILLIIFATSSLVFAQQDVQFTQYMYNMSVVNPAYATDNDDQINLGLINRSQWVGAVGSPKTFSFFGHANLNDKMQTGISIVHDEIGDVVKEDNISIDLNYILDFEDNRKFSFGLKAGFTLFKTDFSNFQLGSGNITTDNFFSTGGVNETFVNMGVGSYYYTNKFYAGISVPNILRTKHIDGSQNNFKGVEEIHMFFISGYVFDLSDKFKLKPSTLIKGVKGAPLAIDLSANVLYNEKVEAGLSYRWDDSFSGMVNFKVLPMLRVGYAYDHTVSNLGEFNSGTHEVLVLFDINLLGKGHDKSPRFF